MTRKTVLIAGDFAPTQSNRELFQTGQTETLFGAACRKLFAEADYSIINLETPLVDTQVPIKKWGPNLIAPGYCAAVIRDLGVNAAGLSNNHCLDQGEQGLRATMTALNGAGIGSFGAGMTQEEASRPMLVQLGEKKVAVYACCEHEFTYATAKTGGANPFDPLETLDEIREIRRACDYLIVLFHGGIEFYRYPSPRQRKTAHKMVEAGADLVVYQHSHCVGCREKYGNGEILYGQGNFLFDGGDNEYWQSGLLIRLTLAEENRIEYLPVRKSGNTVRLCEETDRDILTGFQKRSEEILRDGFVEEQYQAFSVERLTSYLYRMGGKITKSVPFRGMNRLSGQRIIRRVYDEEELLCLIDYLRCEAHNELIDTACTTLTYGSDKTRA